jgi:3-dehydroquinate dehydratase-1
MGNFGKMSRLLCLLLGSPYTYVSLGKPIAPGQFSLDEVKSIFTGRK